MTFGGRQQAEKYHSNAVLMFSTLSNADALRIFELAADGIDANKGVLEEHHFSKKRYYVRLRKLVEMGLVSKYKGVYKHTPFGSIVYENQIASLKRILAKKGSFEILGDLQRRNGSDEAFQSAILDLSQQVMKDVETTIGLSDMRHVRLTKTWSEFTSQISSIANLARSDVTIAARSIDFNVASAALKAAGRGCNVNIIHNRIREFNDPKEMNVKSREDVLNAMNALRTHPNVRLRRSGILYSFFLIDKSNVVIEIPHPGNIESFFLGVSFHNPNIAAKLGACYQEIVKGVEIDSALVIDSDNGRQIK